MLVTARSIVLFILVPVLLCACASSPTVHYFSLSATDSGYRQDPDDAVVLGLGPLSLPDYLNRSQLVTRGAGAALEIDEFNRWAEPLGPSLHRVVSSDVDGMLDGVVVVAFPYQVAQADVDYRLRGDVYRFEADGSGRIVLEVQWGITATGDDLVVRPHRSRYETRAATAGDSGAVAVAMNEALASFSRDIADALKTVLQDQPQ